MQTFSSFKDVRCNIHFVQQKQYAVVKLSFLIFNKNNLQKRSTTVQMPLVLG